MDCKRNREVDFLRFVGLSLIILAHVDPPTLIFQLRNFDVPLMVMVSGISFGISYRNEPYGVYIWKRIRRLVFPVWMFLSIYFSLSFATGVPLESPSWEKIVSSYLLLSGIGYVWIIRVFLLVALVSPFIWIIHKHTILNKIYFLKCAGIYLAYELLVTSTRSLADTPIRNIIEISLLYLIPYSLVFSIGLRLSSMTRPEIKRLCLGAFLTFILIGVMLYLLTGNITPTQNSKYPPTAYYLSFALAGSTLLWLSTNWILSRIKFIKILQFIEFSANNSIWIYLWHIPIVQAINLSYWIKYPLVFMFATTVTFIQVKCVTSFIIPRIHSISTKKQLQTLFTG